MTINPRRIKRRNDPMRQVQLHREQSGAGTFGDEGLQSPREHLVHRDVEAELLTSTDDVLADESLLIAAMHSRIDPTSPEYDAKLAHEIENSFDDSDDDGGDKDQESVLAEALDAYTDPSNPEYDPEFNREIRALRPDWFEDDGRP
jgi:hypothetical protein